MDTKGLQKEFINWCKSNNKSPKSEDETKLLFVAFMKEKHPEEYKAAIENQLKQAKKAAHGAKLNYFKSLKNQCAEDEEVVYYKKGGSVGCGCKKKEDGGEIKKAESGWRANFEKRDSVQTKSDPTEGGKKKYDPNTKKYVPVTEEDRKKWKKNLDDARKGKGEGTPERKCGGKVKKNEDGSKINKNCGGSAIAKFKMHRLGGSLNRIPFMQKGTSEGGVKYYPEDEFSGWDLVPFVGSARDIRRAYHNPSTGNIINAGISTAGDALGLGAIGAVAKVASKYNKIAKALKAKGFFRPTGTGTEWIKVGTKKTPINAGKFGTIGVRTEPAVYTKTVPEVDITAPVMWGFSSVPARTIKSSLYELNK